MAGGTYVAGAECPGAYVPRDVDARLTVAWKAGGAFRNPKNTGCRGGHYKQRNVAVHVMQPGFLGQVDDVNAGRASG